MLPKAQNVNSIKQSSVRGWLVDCTINALCNEQHSGIHEIVNLILNGRPWGWKLDLCDKTTYKYTKDKNLVWNQYTLFDSSRFIHSDCWSSTVKMAMPTGEHYWKKNSSAPCARTSNLWIPSLTRSPLSYLGRYVEWDLNVYCTVLYIATMLHLTAEPRGRPIASSIYFY